MRRNPILLGALAATALLAAGLVMWRRAAHRAWPARFDDHRVLAPLAADDSPAGSPSPRPLPAGERLRLPISRDAWFSRVGREAEANLGGATRLKFKSSEEFVLVDFDPGPLRGRCVLGATLHLRLAGENPLRRVSASTLAADWVEGNGTGYRAAPASSSFLFRVHPRVPWSYHGSDLSSVVLGNGQTTWFMADALPPDREGWQRLAIEPLLLAARVAGLSHGLCLFDDTGSEWSVDGERFLPRKLPERYVFSRERGEQFAPYLTVVLGEADGLPPGDCPGLQAEPTGSAPLPRGELLASWLTPADQGASGTIGFLVEVNNRPVPRYLVPMAGQPGQRVFMHVRDMEIDASQPVVLSVRAVDGAGNVGARATLRTRASDYEPPVLPNEPPRIAAESASLPRLAGCQIAVVDLLDKVHPITGRMIPEQPPDYLAGNHLWSARRRSVALHAARGEITGFQILFSGRASQLEARLRFNRNPFRVWLSEPRYVPTPRGPLPDPAVPVTAAVSLPAGETLLQGQQYHSLLCEILVHASASPGEHRALLELTVDSQRLEIPVAITVWNFALPDALSFVPEMNCYRLPPNERDYYRLAHEHRCVVNRLPYAQRGEVAPGCAPERRGGHWNWFAWDERFGPLLDGSAFTDLPRAGVPVDCFYLPIHENWPEPIDAHYNGSYWADQAFTSGYREALVDAVRQFADHIGQRRWNRTIFQLYLNNKHNFKRGGWKQGSSPWLLDEPLNFQDYWALRWYGLAFHEGLSRAQASPQVLFRADISRPEWQRDALDAVLDYNVVGSFASRTYRRLLLERRDRFGQLLVDYGTANAIDESNAQAAGWCLEAWALGSDGVLPWKAVGNAESWNTSDPTALIYPGEPAGVRGAVPSLRLKAFLRGQQDVEYLAMLAGLLNAPRWAMGRQVRQALALQGEARGSGQSDGEDAGVIAYARLRPQDLWSLRVRVGAYLSRHGGYGGAAGRPMAPRRDRAAREGYVTVGETPWNR